jgi:hypothetical protein|tara:strand:+ start:139 stop:504 length:366 start_codon:yes stop_codon:yes gene_type:complete
MTDAHKQMNYIKSLESRLKANGGTPDDGKNSGDWETLSRMKKDLGMPVEYKTDTEKKEEARASAAGWDGKSPRDLALEKAGMAAKSYLENMPDAQKKVITDLAKSIKDNEKKEETKEEAKA